MLHVKCCLVKICRQGFTLQACRYEGHGYANIIVIIFCPSSEHVGTVSRRLMSLVSYANSCKNILILWHFVSRSILELFINGAVLYEWLLQKVIVIFNVSKNVKLLRNTIQ